MEFDEKKEIILNLPNHDVGNGWTFMPSVNPTDVSSCNVNGLEKLHGSFVADALCYIVTYFFKTDKTRGCQ